jgi:hypothetical protein
MSQDPITGQDLWPCLVYWDDDLRDTMTFCANCGESISVEDAMEVDNGVYFCESCAPEERGEENGGIQGSEEGD